MKSLRKHGWLLLLCLCMMPCMLHATSDTALTVTLPNGNYIPKGQLAIAELTITNLGPDPVTNLAAGTGYRRGQGQTIAIARIRETAPCYLGYTDVMIPGAVLFDATTTFRHSSNQRVTLNAGESHTCLVGIYVFPDAPNIIDHSFVSDGYISDSDPVKSNNLFNLRIQTSLEPKKVPVNNLWALLLLTLMMPLLAFAFKKATHNVSL